LFDTYHSHHSPSPVLNNNVWFYSCLIAKISRSISTLPPIAFLKLTFDSSQGSSLTLRVLLAGDLIVYQQGQSINCWLDRLASAAHERRSKTLLNVALPSVHQQTRSQVRLRTRRSTVLYNDNINGPRTAASSIPT
jgi:hypothetical protein